MQYANTFVAFIAKHPVYCVNIVPGRRIIDSIVIHLASWERSELPCWERSQLARWEHSRNLTAFELSCTCYKHLRLLTQQLLAAGSVILVTLLLGDAELYRKTKNCIINGEEPDGYATTTTDALSV